jgi:uncharacterized protein (DUF885 family)
VRTPTLVDRIADEHTRKLAALAPLAATAFGITGYDHLVGDFSPVGHQSIADLNQATLDALDAVLTTDDADVVTVAAMRDRLGLELELHAAGEYRADLNVIASPPQAFRDTLDLMPTASTQDWANIAGRVGRIPAAIDGYLESLREGLATGLVPALLQADEVAKQADKLADPASSFFVTFCGGARPDGQPASGALTSDLEAAGLAAAASYGKLARFLREEVAPVAPESDAVGRERYERFSRLFVSAAIDLEETYEWGVEELARVVAEQDAVIARIAGPGRTVADAAKVLDADASRVLHGTEALREWMQGVSDAAIRDLDGTHFDIAPALQRLECCIAPSQSGGIYYTQPTDDFSRPGRMWWSVPEGVTEFSTWNERTTVYHEGVPGHHLQIAQAVANRDELNMWRRLVCWTSGHGEGWALYAERLMDEFGYLADDGDRLGMLDAQRLRATRVVVDLGVHLGKPAPAFYGGGVWDADKAWSLLCDNVTMERKMLRFELNRYLGWPGQAPSYKVGQRIWEEMRADAAAAARARGEEFSLRDFHRRALNLGSLPLDVLRAHLNP